jgi:hypothetical protein
MIATIGQKKSAMIYTFRVCYEASCADGGVCEAAEGEIRLVFNFVRNACSGYLLTLKSLQYGIEVC